jgi:hypothetical protein
MSQQQDEQVVPMPIIAIRIVQFIFAVIVLGLNGFLIARSFGVHFAVQCLSS